MRARCEPGGLRRVESVRCGSSGLAGLARGFALARVLVFGFVVRFAMPIPLPLPSRASPRPGGAPDTAYPGATGDLVSRLPPGGASTPALRASAARTRAARFRNEPAGSAAHPCRAAAMADHGLACACGISGWGAA